MSLAGRRPWLSVFSGTVARASHGFDVQSAHEEPCRSLVVRLLDEHSDLAGQAHALSRDDWKVLWAPGRAAYLPFVEASFTLIGWRDPVGPIESRPSVMPLFRRYAERAGKHAVVLGLAEPAALQAQASGYRPFWIGSEQFFDAKRFTTRGRAGEKVRLASNHARRVGLRARESFPLASAADRRRLLATDEAWKAARPARKLRSFLRTDPMENAAMRRYFLVERGGEHAIDSFVVCSPVSRRGWYLQDLVRHPLAPRGSTELVTLSAITSLIESGALFVTAGIVPFLDPAATPRIPRPRGLATWAVRHFDRRFRFSGLKQFRAKFPATRAEPVFAAYWPDRMTPAVVWDLARTLG